MSSNFTKPQIYFIEGYQHAGDKLSRWNLSSRLHVWRPPTDVFETENGLIIRIEIAGMQEDDFTILLDGQKLSVRGMRYDFPERRAYHQMEIPFGEFASEVDLPFNIDSEHIEAVYQAGFLRITLPRREPQHVSIQLPEE